MGCIIAFAIGIPLGYFFFTSVKGLKSGTSGRSSHIKPVTPVVNSKRKRRSFLAMAKVTTVRVYFWDVTAVRKFNSSYLCSHSF